MVVREGQGKLNIIMLEERIQAGHAAAETRAGTGQQSAAISRGNGKRRMHAEGGMGSWEVTLFILTVAGKKKKKAKTPTHLSFNVCRHAVYLLRLTRFALRQMTSLLCVLVRCARRAYASCILQLAGCLIQAVSAANFMDDTDVAAAFFTILALVLLLLGMGISYAFGLCCFRAFRVDERGNIF